MAVVSVVVVVEHVALKLEDEWRQKLQQHLHESEKSHLDQEKGLEEGRNKNMENMLVPIYVNKKGESKEEDADCGCVLVVPDAASSSSLYAEFATSPL